ncbi:MAG: metallophosphoesterase [Parachlamydiaceae bacterium]
MINSLRYSLLWVTVWLAQLTAESPLAVYLTWEQAPHQTMVIQWISPLSAQDVSNCYYKPANSNSWNVKTSASTLMPNGMKYVVHRVELNQLHSDTEYLFRLEGEAKEYKFLTLPAKLVSPLTFAVGGDVYQSDLDSVIAMNKQVASTSPHFVVWGGDLAYAANRYFLFLEKGSRWLDLMAAWSKTMVTPNGHLIPLLAVIGNHEVTGRYNQTPAQAPFFYTLFPMPGYRTLDVGNYLSLFLLDSGHTHPVEGKQREWLKEELKLRQGMPYKFAFYHVPAYPCVRDYHNPRCTAVRKQWIPLFEEFKLNAAFEHHDHAYKRTHLIKEGKVNEPEGVLYLGDGAWGVYPARKPHSPKSSWYLAKTAQEQHFIKVTLYPDFSTKVQAINEKGAIFDEYQQKAR